MVSMLGLKFLPITYSVFYDFSILSVTYVVLYF